MMPPPPPRIGLSASRQVGDQFSSQLIIPFDPNNLAPERSLSHRPRSKSSSSSDSEFSATESAKRNKKPAKANDRSRSKSSSSSDSEFSATERAKRKKPIYNPGEHFGESSGESKELTKTSANRRDHIETNGTRVLQEYDCEGEFWYRIATYEGDGNMYWCSQGENN
jgi:DNA mismatch repair ATPase MutL